jgi:hypothetical protein
LARRVDLDIVVGRHTVRMGGHQVIQLRNVARIYSLSVDPRTTEVFVRMLVELVVLSAGIGGFYVVLTKGGAWLPLSAGDLRSAILGLFLMLILIYLVRVVRLGGRRAVYVFAMDITGGSCFTLASEDRNVVNDLMHLIAGAIENPPSRPVMHHIQNLIMGDQINQSGSGTKIGKQAFGV